MEPLNRQFRQVFNKITKKEERIPAIDKFFVQDRTFLVYTTPPLAILTKSSLDFQASLDEYEERLSFIEQDLKWLLSLPYQSFWCQIIYDHSCQKLIDSYLKFAPRPHDSFKLNKLLPDKLLDLHNRIHRYVFLVCLRMSTHKESKENFMDRDAFASIIYDNFLFDIPKVLDLCVLYKHNQVLNKLIENLFASQPNYYDDFKMCIKDIIKALEISKRKLRDLFDLDHMDAVRQSSKLSTNKTSQEEPLGEKLQTKKKELFENIYYISDSVITINDLVSIQSKLSEILFEKKFLDFIKDILENTLFEIKDILKQLKRQDTSFNESAVFFKSKLKLLEYQLVKLFHCIFTSALIKPVVQQLDTKQEEFGKQSFDIHYCVDNLVKVCCDLLESKRFLCFYEEHFALSEQIELFYTLSNNKMDKTQYDYIMENFKQNMLMHSKKYNVKERFSTNEKVQQAEPKASTTYEDKPMTSKQSEQVGDELEEMAQTVLNLFPDYDKEFIKKCIQYFNKNVEQVINALLENNLPQFASSDGKIDSSNQKESQENRSDLNEKFSQLSIRKNVFDNDEFDVFNQDQINLSKVHFGKSGKTDSLNLDNERDMVKEATLKHYEYQGIREQEIRDYEFEYEDEYDDTYDENTYETDTFVPQDLLKPLNQKISMKKSDLWAMDEEDEEGGQEGQKKRDEFIKKPKNLELKQPEEQQRKEQFRNDDQQRRNVPNKNVQEPTQRFEAKPQRTKTHQRHANNSRNESKSAPNSQQSNQQETKSGGQVVEEAEGGEQASKPKTYEEVKRERRWKNDNKAKVVHHNRKELAAKKMSRGFF